MDPTLHPIRWAELDDWPSGLEIEPSIRLNANPDDTAVLTKKSASNASWRFLDGGPAAVLPSRLVLSTRDSSAWNLSRLRKQQPPSADRGSADL